MSESDDDCEEAWESGPFCQHWGDPSYCEVNCKRCGHTCAEHYPNENCRADDCVCPEFIDEDDENT